MLEASVEANNGRGQIIAHIGAGHFDMGYTVCPARLQTKEEKSKLKEDLEKINFFDMVK